MGTRLLTLGLVLCLGTLFHAQTPQLQLNQGHHHDHDHVLIEEVFASLNLQQVINSLNVNTRYDEETAVEDLVNQAYTSFQQSIKTEISNNPEISQEEINVLIQNFLADLGNQIQLTPKNKNKQPNVPKVLNGPCVNMDFETGNLTGWDLWRGTRTSATLYDFSSPVPVGPGANHQIFGGGVDPVVGIPRVAPGGNFSVRLGNGTTTGSGAARMSQAFLVDASNMYFTYQYAVVFQSPAGHAPNELSYFTVRVYDQNGVNIPCGEYSVVANAATASNYQSVVVGGNTILYQNWTSVFTNLSAYVGQNVTVEFTSGDCSLSGHYGYAYVDASCVLQQLVATPGVICPGQTTTLTAPAGVGTFTWSTGATTQSINTSTPGPYSVILTPPQGAACSVTLNTSVTEHPQPVAAFSSTAPLCLGNPVNFNSSSSIPAPGVIATYQWNFGDGISTPASSGTISGVANTSGTYTAPVHTYAAPGTYNVVLTVVSTNGCTHTVTIPTTVYPRPQLSTTQTNVLCNGLSTGEVNLSVTSGTPGFSYAWSNGAVTEDLTGVPAGSYTVVVTDLNGCTATTSATLTQPVSALNLSFTQTDVLCFGGSTGAINLTVAGGTPGYTYAWSNGAITQDLSGLSAGTYSVTVTDLNGCTATTSVTITQPSAAVSLSQTNSPVLCFGASTGAIDLTVAGGTAPYTYSWSNGAITQDLTNVPTGTYTVVVNDANGSTGGCTATTTVTITQPAAAINITSTQVNNLCNGGSTGSIDVTVTGGTAPYTYSWSNGALTQDISGLSAGTYTLNVDDLHGPGGGCSATATFTITQPANPVALSHTQTNVACFGGTTGSINLSVTGGTGPYSYSWSNGAVVEDIAGLAAGSYTVVVNDANGSTGGCTATLTVNIAQPGAAVAVSTTQTNVLCNGGSTGAVDLTVSGGIAPYTYSWSNGAVTQDLTNIPAGTYTVVVNDVNGTTGGCTATTTVTITQPSAPLTLSSTQVNILCNGGNTGSIDLTPSGGTAPYSYSWSNGATTQDLTGIVAGSYTVVVTDANGTTGGCTATATMNITQPANALSVSTTQTNVLCFAGTTGAIDLTVTGGTSPYSYSWSNGAVVQDLSSLPAGTYTVVVNDANGSSGGCTATTTVTITQPAAALSLASNQTNVLCNGGLTGAIDLTPSGGTAPYTYSWSNGAISQDLSGIAAGTYTVVVTDANGSTGGCTATATFTITQPAAPVALTETNVDILCNGGSTGSIDLNVTGGTAPYTYAWSNGAITQDLTNIPAGNYTVVVTDANGSTGGCTATIAVAITQPAAAVSVATSQTNILCFGGTTGAVNLTVNGGTAPYSYSWSNGSVSEDLTNIPAGTYTVVVTDANGTTGGCTATTTVTLTQPVAAVSVNTTQTNVLCNGALTGAIDLSVNGGTLPYTYSWSNGAFTQDLSSLAAGTYTVIVNDANGTTGGCTATTTVTITQPPVLTQTITSPTYPSGTNISCFGLSDGNIDLTIGGGNPGYTYVWSNGATTQDLNNIVAGTYNVIVTDANGCTINSSITLTQPAVLTSNSVPSIYVGGFNVTGCNADGTINLTVNGGNPAYSYSWSNGAVTEDLAALNAGTYSYTVTDINGCQTTGSLTLTAPAPLAQSITSFTYPSGDNISCFGLSDGNIDLTITGGAAPYTYLWNTGATTQDLPNVPAGTYNVTVTDQNGCQITSSITLTEPPLLTTGLVPSVYAGGFNVSGCVNDGTIDLTVTGGSPGYSYSWSNGSATEDINSLIAGGYSVTVTDLNGCQSTANIVLTQPAGINQSISAVTYPSGTNISCFGLSDGSIDLDVSGGVPGYTYLWNTGAVTQDLAGVPAGSYSVVITDANGCQASAAIVLTQPTLLTQNISAATYANGDNISCFGLSNGNIDLTVSGGNPGYSYAWNTGAITQDLPNVPAGSYNVTVTDINGCTVLSSITLTQPPALTQTISAVTYPSGTNISCFGLNDGSIDLTIGGGAPGYTYVWTNGSSNQDLSSLTAGTYNVVVTDINGCTINSGITLTQPTVLTEAISAFAYPSGTNISCFGLSDGSIDLTINGGNPGYTYAWSNGAVTQDLTNIPAGTYNVVVTDINGCSIPSSITLVQPTALNQAITAATYPSGTNISCNGLSDGNINLSVNGGNPAYSFVWNTGAVTEDLPNVPAGTYSVNVTDVNGCSVNTSITLTEPTILTSGVVPSVYAGGFNVSGCVPDGTIDLTVNGGNPGYSYVWSNGSNNQDLSNLSAGTYNVTVTDINGCQTTSSITLTAPTGMTQTISAFTYPSGNNISCNGLSDGSIDLTINDGVAPYTYLWNTGAVTQDLTNVPAGTYNVVVTDQNGCQINSSITLNQPAPLNQGITAFTYPSGNNISCFGSSDGSVDLTIGGGSPGYTYVWSNGATTEDIAGLAVGTYSVVVTDINGCTIPSTITLNQPTALTQSISAGTYPSGNNISCFGFNDGSIDLVIGGGSPGYTYVWSNAATTEDLTNLTVGTYDVTVTDINGCIITSTITLNQPTALTNAISAATYPSGNNISCFGLSDGSIDLTISNGSPGYTYVWSTGATTEDVSGLPAGTYDVTATDINGCIITSTITLDQPTALTQGISSFTYPSGDNISCYGFNDGSIDLTIGGGSPVYSYSWSTGAVTEDLSGLTAGTYNVVVTDINGCTIPSTITLFEPTALTEAITAATYPSGDNISCFGLSDGSIDLTIGGGSPGYTYLWSTGAITQDINGVPAGIYNVTVTDINGCVIPSTITLIEPTVIDPSLNISVYAGGYNVTCNPDGWIDLTVVDGSPGYTYLWSTGDVTEDLSDLPAGTYDVTITDINGCTATTITTLVQAPNITSTTSVTTNYNGQDISCFGASDGGVTVDPLGGAPAYSYAWTNASGVNVGNTQAVNGLPFGLYTVTVTDQNNCVHTNTVNVTQPTPFITDVVVATDYNGQNISCFGASDGGIDLTVNGSTPGYTYTWSNSTPSVVSNLEDPFGLVAGTYSVLIQDVNGCTTTTSITLNQPTLLTAIPSVTSDYNGQDVSCFGSTDGSVTVAPNGGTPGYTYIWTDVNSAIIGTDQNLGSIGAGSYNVQVTDVNGCTQLVPLIVTQPQQIGLGTTIVSNYFGNPVSCEGEMDGIVDANATGGTPLYSYSWNGGPSQASLTGTNLGEGINTVQVTDANGCTAITSVNLTANPNPQFNLPPVIYSCEGYPVSIDSGAEPGSNCTWVFSNGLVVNDCGPVYVDFGTEAACYDVQLTVTNTQGCNNSISMTDFICVVPNPVANFTPSTFELSTTNNDVIFYNNSEGAENYYWDFGDGSPLSTDDSPYHVYPATDDNPEEYEVWLYAVSEYGCIDSTVRYIGYTEELILYVPNTFTPDGDEFNNDFFPVLSSGYSDQGYSLFIFNRWGELIFESHDPAVGWDGTYNGQLCQDGTYTWKLIVKKTENDDKAEFVGHVNLIR